MNRILSSDLSEVEHLLPKKRKGKPGIEPGMNLHEAKRRYLDRSEESSWTWPQIEPTDEKKHLLMAIMLEIAVKFFFNSFVFTFGGEFFIQATGGPIGAD